MGLVYDAKCIRVSGNSYQFRHKQLHLLWQMAFVLRWVIQPSAKANVTKLPSSRQSEHVYMYAVPVYTFSSCRMSPIRSSGGGGSGAFVLFTRTRRARNEPRAKICPIHSANGADSIVKICGDGAVRCVLLYPASGPGLKQNTWYLL